MVLRVADRAIGYRGDHHGAGDGEAVGVGQVAAFAKEEDEGDGADGEDQVDAGQENLPLRARRWCA